MMPPRKGAGGSSRQRHGAKRKGRPKGISKPNKRAPADLVALIDAALIKTMVIQDRGRSRRITAYEAILHRLWTLEMKGDVHAARVRLRYEALARSHRDVGSRPIVIEGGLPDDDLARSVRHVR